MFLLITYRNIVKFTRQNCLILSIIFITNLNFLNMAVYGKFVEKGVFYRRHGRNLLIKTICLFKYIALEEYCNVFSQNSITFSEAPRKKNSFSVNHSFKE